MSELVKSIYDNQDILLTNLCRLHGIGQFDLDPTYSKGNFYKAIPQPKIKGDINPPVDGVLPMDSRNLSLGDETITSIMFDPPFLATKGPSLNINNESNKILKRFSVYPTEQELFAFYYNSLEQFYRVLKPNGLLVFKCQDKVSRSLNIMSHCIVYNQATEIGFASKDLFILVARSRMTPQWQTENQQHARKFHSYFWVFKKDEKMLDNLGKIW